jgi:hypothetical protein
MILARRVSVLVLVLLLAAAAQTMAGSQEVITSVIDTLPRGAALDELRAKCQEMNTQLQHCHRRDDVVDGLLRKVYNEEVALGRILPKGAVSLLGAPLGALPGACIGAIIGGYIEPPPPQACELASNGILVGCPVGCVVGAGIGAVIGMQWRKGVIARHRNRVNDLVLSVNLVVASAH